ncbi:flagellin [Sinorhizobium meliloti]|uniref:Flagellin D n=1 Tax=Rhizobium meliloti (strain 1021) TaxID=266834 RepID=FLAD_RHIME|nr:flagellin [Sinorhizobium meliloti]P58330.1 RecName: Full=Flagellin D [Sinorhizobium meliloti 1021]TWA89446.1 flagellin [Ensifer sp. SEMIA 134]TWB25563.1 flagellin [Ensifer sp. SEMIA 135]AEG03222.1 flagellin domain protein [Sinorhizobium meliloti BL225C]AGA05630.1 Flagellin-related hook-associated protein [Sinorhizobium meliloti GR4]AGG73251.1 Flagellin D [Sinorhizobium meliloti 2011]
MTSILTNVAAMAALQTLRGIDSNMEETQARVSSGLRVGTASDNAAYWSIATTMRSDNMALSAVQDALGLGAAKVDTAYAGMENAVEVVKEIRAKLVAATEDGVDKAKIQEEIEQLKQQLTSIATAASFSGENWLQADITTPVTKSVVGSFVRDSSGVVSVKTIDYVLDGNSVLFDTVGDAGILDKIYNVSQASVTLPVNVNGTTTEYTVAAYAVDELIAAGATFDGDSANVTGYTVPAGGIDYNGNFVKVEGTWVRAIDVAATGQEVVYDDGTTKWGVDTTVAGAPAINVVAPASIENIDITNAAQAANLDALIRGVDEALEDLISATSALGSISMRIGMQEEFVSKLTDSIDSGIGRLVDADMNEESTRLKALQTQQQLAIQSLSIANTNSENILQLFRQ